jgi:hypothetical protein
MEERFIIVRDWMIGGLGLSGFDLLIYALINGYSQANSGSYHGSLQDTADWVGCTRRTAIDSFKYLIRVGLVRSFKYTDENGQRRVAYMAVDEGGEIISPVQKFHQGSEIISPEGSEIISQPPYINTIRKDKVNTNPNACAREDENDSVDGQERATPRKLSVEERIEVEQAKLRESLAKFADQYPQEMLDNFAAYWGEPFLSISPSSRRLLRWQGEKTWDVAGRLRTWARRDNEYRRNLRPTTYQRTPLRPVCETDGRSLDEICAAAEAQEKADKEAGYYD